jgi:hypothetical protein
LNTTTTEAPAAAGFAPTDAAAAANQLITQAQASAQFRLDLTPRNFDEAWRMAEILADSDMVPKDYRGKPGNCLIAMQWGAELGLHWLQAIQNIAVINGRPALWGDAMLALVRASPLCEYVSETIEAGRALCRVKRRGEPEQTREFTLEDAKSAQLLGKQGPWQQYTKRMLQMRARAWALRDVFTDVLKGIGMAEELRDVAPEQFMGMAEVVTPAAATPAASPATAATEVVPAWTDEQMAQRETKIREFFGKGKTADDVIAFYATKATVTDDQQKRIRALHAEHVKAKQEPTTIDAATGETSAPAAPRYADIAHQLVHATTIDDLNAAGDLIRFIADEDMRSELKAKFDKREQELTAGG